MEEGKEGNEPVSEQQVQKEETKHNEAPAEPLEEDSKHQEEHPQEPEPEANGQDFSASYADAIVDRKKESFLAFQSYETNRRNLVEKHRNILTTLATNVDARLMWIEAGIEKVVKFFKDRAQQEEDYVKIMSTSLPKLSGTFKDPAHPEIFANLSKAMDECDEFHVRQSKNSELLAKFLKKNILADIILTSEKEFKKQFDALIAPLEDLKKKFTSLNQERLKRLKTYVFSYNEAERGRKITKEKDMFNNELNHVCLGHEELKMMKTYSTQTIILVTETVKLLIKRFTDIQKAFSLYFQKYSELYGSKAANPEVVVQLMERFNSTEEVKQAFMAKTMLKIEEVQYIKQTSGKADITYQEVFDVLTNVPEPPDILRSPLVIKQWKAMKEGGLLKGSKPCHVVVTIDHNILVLEKSADGDLAVTDNILQLVNLKVMPREDKKDYSVVELMEVIPGLLIDSKTKVTLKFSSADSAEEFRHYVYNFYTTNVLEQKK